MYKEANRSSLPLIFYRSKCSILPSPLFNHDDNGDGTLRGAFVPRARAGGGGGGRLRVGIVGMREPVS